MLDSFLYNPEFWRFVSIPVGAAILGWVTNWVAIQLTFWPIKYVGIRPWLGWQGIIPSKAGKMARISVEKSLSRIGNIGDLIDRVGPDKILDHLTEFVDPRVEELVDEVICEHYEEQWRSLPEPIREHIYATVRQRLPYTLEELIFEGLDHLDEIFDLEEMAVNSLLAHPEILNRMFLEAGRKELRFIVQSGLLFGGLFGLVQLAVWYFAPWVWLWPIFGMIVGFATNWVALNVIFRPLHPVKIGPWTIQGMFLRRQSEVARRYCHILAHELLNSETIIDSILTGSKAETVRQLVDKRVREYQMQDDSIPPEMVEQFLGPNAFDKLAQSMTDTILRHAREPFADPAFKKERAEQVEKMLADRFARLSPEEFQDVLRPAFQEDEWLLIAVGAVLGFLAGLSQVFLVFGS
ncbi:MAG: DUF445 domain-containing protein [Pseudomonadota bacterium]